MDSERKMAPVQGYEAGIPWSMHLEAYDVYRKRYGQQRALIEGWCRGGFGTNELDIFIPGWRERASEIMQLRHQLAATIAERDRAVNELAALRNNMARAADCSHQCRRCGLAYTPAADSTTEDCPACGYDGHADIAAGGEEKSE